MRNILSIVVCLLSSTVCAWEYTITNHTGSPVLVKIDISTGPDLNKWVDPGETIIQRTKAYCARGFEVRGTFFREIQSNPNGGPLGCWGASVDIKYAVRYWDSTVVTEKQLPNNCTTSNPDQFLGDDGEGALDENETYAGAELSDFGLVVGYNMEIE